MTVDVFVGPTGDLSGAQLDELRDLLHQAFRSNFSDDDWDHTRGGVHAVVSEDGVLVSHAAVVPRTLVAAERSLSVGYVEAVASTKAVRHRGYATRAMRAIGEVITSTYDLGALSTGVWDFYSRLGWERWKGLTYVDAPEGRMRTPEDDDSVMVLRTPHTTGLDLTSDLTCDWRSGDVW